jgi:hypothetical protein
MRTSFLAIIVTAGSTIAFQAMAQQAAPSQLTREQMDRGSKAGEPNEQADKGIKTLNSGESGYVSDQDKQGASAHPPGRPNSQQTTRSQTGTPK